MEADNLYGEEIYLGYCLYCKEEIFKNDDYVVRGNDYYHVDCFNKLQGIDNYDDDNDYE